jgi:glycosyltransferase involved in cell wall biosynthesis
MNFIYFNLLSGIGQVVQKYCDMLNGKMVQITADIPPGLIFLFLLPTPAYFDLVRKLKSAGRKVLYMTVCETETVHEDYGAMFKLIGTKTPILVPSDFCGKVFKRQYPEYTFKTVRHYVPVPPIVQDTRMNLGPAAGTYIFYHIGNVIDPRKQIQSIVNAFTELDLPGSSLVLKATGLRDVQLNIPNIYVINGLIPPAQIQAIHHACDCYVSFSHSEGVGMGAVEAALNDNPVIITDYGGACEYIKTPYLINCTIGPIGYDDFLFKKDMQWGHPDYDQLKQFMKDAYTKKMVHMDHSHTKKLVSAESIKLDLMTLAKPVTNSIEFAGSSM